MQIHFQSPVLLERLLHGSFSVTSCVLPETASVGCVTFLRGSNQQRPAVPALELIEIGPDFNFILGSFQQTGEDAAALRGGVDVLEEPRSAAGAVKEAVALDKLGLAVNLRRGKVRNLSECVSPLPDV